MAAKNPKRQSAGWLSRFRKDHGEAEEVREGFSSVDYGQTV
jgi:hypothetical protein